MTAWRHHFARIFSLTYGRLHEYPLLPLLILFQNLCCTTIPSSNIPDFGKACLLHDSFGNCCGRPMSASPPLLAHHCFEEFSANVTKTRSWNTEHSTLAYQLYIALFYAGIVQHLGLRPYAAYTFTLQKRNRRRKYRSIFFASSCFLHFFTSPLSIFSPLRSECK